MRQLERHPLIANDRSVLARRLGTMSVDCSDWAELIEAANGLSYADVTRAADEALKDAIIAGSEKVTRAQ